LARPSEAQLLAGYNILGACGDSILAPRRTFWYQRRSIPFSWRSALRTTKPTVSQPLAGWPADRHGQIRDGRTRLTNHEPFFQNQTKS